MITSSLIQSLGYSQSTSYKVMRKLKALGCTLRKAKVTKSYDRNGLTCNLMYYADGYETEEVIAKLNHYCDNIPCNADKRLWNELLLELKGTR